MSVPCGVVQGSVLGTLLVFIYINDIIQASSFASTLFADVYILNIYLNMSKNVQQQNFRNKVGHQLQNVKYSVRADKLSINYNKINFIILNTPKYDIATSIKVCQICEKMT